MSLEFGAADPSSRALAAFMFWAILAILVPFEILMLGFWRGWWR